MILILAYSAVILSFASGLLALVMNQRLFLLDWFEKSSADNERLASYLGEKQFSSLVQKAVFMLLGLSGVFAVLAGLSVLISQGVVTDQLSLGLPWLPWHVRFDCLSGVFLSNCRYCGQCGQPLRAGLCQKLQGQSASFCGAGLVYRLVCGRDVAGAAGR